MKTLSATVVVPQPAAMIHGLPVYWHLLSLDAPTVAVVWTVFVARACRVDLPASTACAMFLAVWTIYAADRLLDARQQQNLEARHRFHGRHRTVFRAVIAVVCALLIPLIDVMPRACLQAYIALGTALIVWLATVHLLARRSARRIPKELAVGLFFSAAVFVPTVAGNPSLVRTLILPAILFANLCSLNCLFIYAWENADRLASAHPTTAFGLRRLPVIAAASVFVPLAILFTGARAPVLLATALAAAILLILHRWRDRFDRVTLRTLADAALLTPLLVLPFLR